MYTNINRQVLRVYMAKLYWRVKIDNKWTWKPAQVRNIREMPCGMYLQVNLVKLEQHCEKEQERKEEAPGGVVDPQRTRICDEESRSISADKKQEGGIND